MARVTRSARITRVQIWDSRIDAFWSPGGSVRQHANKIGRRTAAVARREAPVRTGNMRAHIDHETTRRGKRHVVTRVRSRSYYSHYVHEGTGGQIGKRRLRGSPGAGSQGWWMPGMKTRWPGGTSKGVRGQWANQFLLRAMAKSRAGVRL